MNINLCNINTDKKVNEYTNTISTNGYIILNIQNQLNSTRIADWNWEDNDQVISF